MRKRPAVRRPIPTGLAALALALSGATLLAGCGAGQGEGEGDGARGQNTAPPTVTVTRARQAEVHSVYENMGRTVSMATVDITARVEGVLQARHFEEGSQVEAGQLLFEIEPDQYRADVAVARASVANAEAAHLQASQYLDRVKSMRRGASAAVDLESAVSDEAQARATLQQARAELQRAELQLGYTRITSPISGRIGKATIAVGNLVSADSGVLTTVIQMDPIYVDYSIAERTITRALQTRAENGEALRDLDAFVPSIRLSTGKVYPEKGRVVFLGNEIDQSTGTLAIRARFDNAGQSLLPGQFVTVLSQRQAGSARVLIPQAAVQQDQAGYYVMTVNDTRDQDQASHARPDGQTGNDAGTGVARQRRVSMGERFGTDWAVDDGLRAGERIVWQGLEKVRDGITLRLNEQPPEEHDPPALAADGGAPGSSATVTE